MAKILITGGSGLLGTHLSNHLACQGHHIVHLSRSPNGEAAFETYKWDPGREYMDPEALRSVDHIVHLAGAGIAEERWTPRRKQVIIQSRVQGINLLFEKVKQSGVVLRSFVSASGIGYYGMDTGSRILTENDPPGRDFLAETVQQWESATDPFDEVTRVARIRIGVVLSNRGGALPVIARPVRLYAGAPLGSGHQMVSWIHIDDLSRLFRFVLEKEMQGTYNAVAPNPVTNEELTKVIAKTLHKPLFLPNVPAFVLKAVLGEMAGMVLGGNNVSGNSIQEAGFRFKFNEIEESVKDLLSA